MTSLFENLTQWHWLILAVVLVGVEVFMPSAFFLWLGISAGVVGILLWLVPAMQWEYQFIIFSVLSVVSVASWRIYLKKHPIKTDNPVLNRRGEQYIGRIFTLKEPIINGVGKIKVDDTTWKVAGEDLPASAKVKVIGIEGTVFQVSEEKGQ